MKRKLKRYWITTNNLAKLGDSMIVVGLGLVGTGTGTDQDWLSYTSIGIVAVGRFLTTFFKGYKNEDI